MLAQLYHNYIFCCMTDLWLFWIWFSRGSYQAKSESDTSHPKKKKHFQENSNLEPGLIANEAGDSTTVLTKGSRDTLDLSKKQVNS